jgi:hypothetical protein
MSGIDKAPTNNAATVIGTKGFVAALPEACTAKLYQS